jgi:hypothetical protein
MFLEKREISSIFSELIFKYFSWKGEILYLFYVKRV